MLRPSSLPWSSNTRCRTHKMQPSYVPWFLANENSRFDRMSGRLGECVLNCGFCWERGVVWKNGRMEKQKKKTWFTSETGMQHLCFLAVLLWQSVLIHLSSFIMIIKGSRIAADLHNKFHLQVLISRCTLDMFFQKHTLRQIHSERKTNKSPPETVTDGDLVPFFSSSFKFKVPCCFKDLARIFYHFL